MKEIMLQEMKSPNPLQCFKLLVESLIPVDEWLDEIPKDIDAWQFKYEFTDYFDGVIYRCFLKFYDLEDGEFIVNAVIHPHKMLTSI